MLSVPNRAKQTRDVAFHARPRSTSTCGNRPVVSPEIACTYSALRSLDKAGRADVEMFVVVDRARGRGRIHAHVALTDPRMTTRAGDIVRGRVAGSSRMRLEG
jgi:hypothetical protein